MNVRKISGLENNGAEIFRSGTRDLGHRRPACNYLKSKVQPLYLSGHQDFGPAAGISVPQCPARTEQKNVEFEPWKNIMKSERVRKKSGQIVPSQE